MLALALAIFMFSLAGIPPLAGFIGKFYVFKAAVDAGLAWFAVVGVVLSVVGAYYYLRIVKLMYFDEPAEAFDGRAASRRRCRRRGLRRPDAVLRGAHRLLAAAARGRGGRPLVRPVTAAICRRASPVSAHETVASTNDVARELAEAGAAAGLVVTARRQTGGRGRHGRGWASPPGNLYAS